MRVTRSINFHAMTTVMTQILLRMSVVVERLLGTLKCDMLRFTSICKLDFSYNKNTEVHFSIWTIQFRLSHDKSLG